MAERRMFAKTIIDSDAFIDMPLSTQALYFHLSMRADDEGFINNPKKIQRMVGATEDDLKLLIAKNFIITFESGVIVIKHWKIHNYIRADRLVKTAYEEEKMLLTTKDNGSYTLIANQELLEDSDEVRKLAYKNSTLPYSFTYKIRRAFEGAECPICKCTMTSSNKKQMPTIQHNIPISKGGEHELGNISGICYDCTCSIKDNETDNLNNSEVVEMWDKICELDREGVEWYWDLDKLKQCPSNVGQMSAQVSIGKVSIGKNSIDKSKRFSKPSLEELQAYINEKGLNVNAQSFMDYYDSVGWKVGGKAPMKDWKATLRRWNSTNKKDDRRPSWLDKDIQRQEATIEEQEEIEELLKDFK